MTLRPQFNSLFFIVLLGFVCLIPLNSVRAQDFVTGAFEGEVTDTKDNPIPDATVQIINKETGVPIGLRTNSQGRFRQGLLPPGDYIIRVIVKGYTTYERPQSLSAMDLRPVIPPMKLTAEADVVAVATPTETATPAPGQPAPQPSPSPVNNTQVKDASEPSDYNIQAEINRSDAQRSGSYSKEQVSTLPLGSTTLTRTFDELGLLVPGVALPPQTLGTVAGPGVGPGVGSAGQFSVNGLRSRANNFTVDGSDNNDEDIGVRRQGFFALVPQPIESIQGYKIVTLLAPAQYGRNMGAQVNAVSKSGGNETHGAFFGFINASQLNARNPFDFVGPNSTIPLQGRILNSNRQTLGAFRNVFVDGRQKFVTNSAGPENSLTLGQGGFVLGGPLVRSDVDASGVGRGDHNRRSLFYFISAEGQLLNANQEESFAVPTVEERGAFRTGASGLFFDPLFPTFNCQLEDFCGGFPTTVGGDAVFSLFPFPNNPNGVYGRNTFTQVLPASAQGKILSGKVNGTFSAFNRPQEFVARYNFTDDWRDIPVTGGGLFSTLRPRVRTQNFSTFLNTNLSGTDSSHPVLNQLRASYGRTRLIFDEVRDKTHLVPSLFARGLPADQQAFLLNAPSLVNFTLPGDTAVTYFTFDTTEQDLNEFDFGPGARLAPVGQVIVAGFSPIGVDVFNFPQRRVNNTYQLADTLTFQFGEHNLAVGTDIRRTELNSDLPRNFRPLLTFNGIPNITGAIPERSSFTGADLAAASAPSGIFQALTPGTDAKIALRFYQYNFFGQDEWALRRNLHLSLGLRYEYNTVPHSAGGKIENTFGATLPSFLSGLRQFIGGRSEIFDSDRNNFAPRLGIGWSPEVFKNRATVVRAGGGIYYDQILGAVVSQSRNVFPNFLNLNFAGGLDNQTPGEGFGSFDIFTPGLAFFRCAGSTQFIPLIQNNSLNTLNPAISTQCVADIASNLFRTGLPITLPARTLHSPTAYHYALSFEQQISGGMVLSAAYVGTQGRHLLHQTTPNLGPNALLYILDFFASDDVPQVFGFAANPGTRFNPLNDGTTGGRPVANAGGVTIFTTDANSRYDALQLQLRGRYHLLGATQFQANYTFGRVNDDASDVFDLAGAPALPQNSLTFAGERGPANFDVRHRVTSDYITNLSSWGRKNSFLHAVFNGLEVAGTTIFQTGQPFTVNSIFDVNLDGNLTDRLNSTSGIRVTGDRAQPLILTGNPTSLLAPIGSDGAVPRNSFRAGNLWLTNAVVIKTFSFSETTKLVFRTEAFNLFNRANYGIPVRFLESPGFGRATDTLTPGRRIQFGLKLLF